ncbi:hypothetical protein GCM10010306_026350 [Streptomyces umbrinus]|nr:hypothetical protein GCM10010306_026350 [Streptomyces umbrinus]
MGPHGLGKAVEPPREPGRLRGNPVAYAVVGADISLGQRMSESPAAAIEPRVEQVEEEIVRCPDAAVRGDFGQGVT